MTIGRNRLTSSLSTVTIVLALLFLCTSVSAAGKGKGKAVHQDAIVTGAGASDVGEGQIIRNKNGLTVHGTAAGLVPGNVHSVWWIVIEEEGPVLVLNATGGIANNNGELHFAAALPVGFYADGEINPRRVLFEGSLTDPYGAFVLNHILDHGPPIPGSIREQMTTVDFGDCDPFPPTGCPLAQEQLYP